MALGKYYEDNNEIATRRLEGQDKCSSYLIVKTESKSIFENSFEHKLIERERAERKRVGNERERVVRERIMRERAEHERAECEQIERERVERERVVRERVVRERVVRERVERERAVHERIERERAVRERQGVLAIQVYQEIQSKASSNMLFQGISSIFGGVVTMGVDVAIIGTHYVPMFNNIRKIYGRGSLDGSVVAPIVKNIFSECLFDVAFDKVLGYVPVLGIYTNVMCAKTMTWRLGVLFAMLASRGEEVYSDVVKDCMFVIRNIFPQNSAYKLVQPDIQIFKDMVISVYNNSRYEFEDKIGKAKDAFR